jgi:hypothetical protein
MMAAPFIVGCQAARAPKAPSPGLAAALRDTAASTALA